MSKFAPLITLLNDKNANDEIKIKGLQDISEKLEGIINSGEYGAFLEAATPCFLKILSEEPINFIGESLEHQIRKQILDIIYRVPCNENMKIFYKQILANLFTLLNYENETNSLIIVKIILELLKQYRPPLSNEIPQFLQFLSAKIKDLNNNYRAVFNPKPNIFLDTLKKDQIDFLLKGLYSSTLVSVNQGNDKPPHQFTLIPKSFYSLKVLSELPIIVVIIYQLYKPNLHQDIGNMIPALVQYISIDSNSAVKNGPANYAANNPIMLHDIHCEFVTSQIKILSFIAYIIRPFQETLTQFSEDLVSGIVALLRNCPPELANMRKEILIALRHLQSTSLRIKFVPYLSEIMSQRLLLGNSVTCFETLCPLAYSSLADMIHHLRQHLTLAQLILAVNVFSRNVQDETLPYSIQNVSCKLLLNLVECIKMRTETENDEKGRLTLDRILRTFIRRLEVMVMYKIPALRADIIKLVESKGITNTFQVAENFLTVLNYEALNKFMDNTNSILKSQRVTDSSSDLIISLSTTAISLYNANNDLKILFKTLVTGVKTVTWGLLTCKIGVNPYILQSKMLLPHEIDIYCDFVKYFFAFVLVYQEFSLQSENGALKTFFTIYNAMAHDKWTASNNWHSSAATIVKDQKECLDTLVGVFLMLNPVSFYEIFYGMSECLIESVLKDNNLIVLFNCFLASSTTSPPFTTILMDYLLDHLKDMGTDRAKGLLYLKIFKLVFGSVSYVNSENEIILKMHLSYMVNSSIQYALETRDPTNFFLLLRYLFRFIGNGTHENLYQEFLPILPTLLQNLNLFLSSGNNIKITFPTNYVAYGALEGGNIINLYTSNSNSNYNNNHIGANIKKSTEDSLNKHVNASNNTTTVSISTLNYLYDIFLELCLTVPVRLSSLLPHLPLLMDPLVKALNGYNSFPSSFELEDGNTLSINSYPQSSQSGGCICATNYNLVSQGLRTLELCVDNLQPEFLREHLDPVRGSLVQSLWQLLNINSNNNNGSGMGGNVGSHHHLATGQNSNTTSLNGTINQNAHVNNGFNNNNNNVTTPTGGHGRDVSSTSNLNSSAVVNPLIDTVIPHTSFRLLGKFGSSNRSFFKHQMLSYDIADGRKYMIGLEFVEGVVIEIPIDAMIDIAFQTLNKLTAHCDELRAAWSIVHTFLSINISIDYDSESSLCQILTHSHYTTGEINAAAVFNFNATSFVKLDTVKRTHRLALASLFLGSAIKELHSEVMPTLINIVNHYALYAVSRQAGPLNTKSFSCNVNNLDDINDEYNQAGTWEVLVEALVDLILGHADKELCKTAIKGLLRIMHACQTVLGSMERVFRLPLLRYVSERIVKLCYASPWFRKYGGCIGINFLVIKCPQFWFEAHHLEYMRALFFVLMDLTNDVSNGTVALAKSAMKKLVNICLSYHQTKGNAENDLTTENTCLALMTKEFITRLASPIKLVRDEVMDRLRQIASHQKQSLNQIMRPYDYLIYDQIPPKKHLLRHQSVNSQFGLMDAIIFCSEIKFENKNDNKPDNDNDNITETQINNSSVSESLGPIFTLDLNLIEHRVFFTELISLCEAEENLLLRLPCYKNLNNDITELKCSALKALVSFHYLTQYHDKIFTILFKSLNGSNSDIQHVAFECLMVFVRSHTVDMEVVHQSIRNLLLMLGDHRNLTPAFLTRLLYYARLFPNTFNEKFCEHLLTHMITLLKVLSTKSGIKTHAHELKVCCEILKIFKALPLASIHVIDSMCTQLLALDPIFLREIWVFLQTDLRQMLECSPENTCKYFFRAIKSGSPENATSLFIKLLKNDNNNNGINTNNTSSLALIQHLTHNMSTYFEDILQFISNNGDINKSSPSPAVDDVTKSFVPEMFVLKHPEIHVLNCIIKILYVITNSTETVDLTDTLLSSLIQVWENACPTDPTIFYVDHTLWDMPKQFWNILLRFVFQHIDDQKGKLFNIFNLFALHHEFDNDFKDNWLKKIQGLSNEQRISIFTFFIHDVFKNRYINGTTYPMFSESVIAHIIIVFILPMLEDAIEDVTFASLLFKESVNTAFSPSTMQVSSEILTTAFDAFIDICVNPTSEELRIQKSGTNSSTGSVVSAKGGQTNLQPIRNNELKICVFKLAILFIKHFNSSPTMECTTIMTPSTCSAPSLDQQSPLPNLLAFSPSSNMTPVISSSSTLNLASPIISTTASLNPQTPTNSGALTSITTSPNRKQSIMLRKLITFAWPCIQTSNNNNSTITHTGTSTPSQQTTPNIIDPSVKYHGHLLLAHIIEKFSIHKRIVIQVLHSLLKASGSEAKTIVKKALEVLIRALHQPDSRVENGPSLLTYWTKKIMIEEGHTLNQLAHILQAIHLTQDVFYDIRHSLIHLILGAMAKLGFSANNVTNENKKLVVELCEDIIVWEMRALTTPTPGPAKHETTNEALDNTAKIESHQDNNTEGITSNPLLSKPLGALIGESIINFLIRLASPVIDITSPPSSSATTSGSSTSGSTGSAAASSQQQSYGITALTGATDLVHTKCYTLLKLALALNNWTDYGKTTQQQLKLTWLDKIFNLLDGILNFTQSFIVVGPIALKGATSTSNNTTTNPNLNNNNNMTTAVPQTQQNVNFNAQQVQQIRMNINALIYFGEVLVSCHVLENLSRPKTDNDKTQTFDKSQDGLIRYNAMLDDHLSLKQIIKVLSCLLSYSLPKISTLNNLISAGTGLESENLNLWPDHDFLVIRIFGRRLFACVQSLLAQLLQFAPIMYAGIGFLDRSSSYPQGTIHCYSKELENFYHNLTALIGEHLGALEKAVSGNQLTPFLHHILCLLRLCSTDHTIYIDRYIPSLMKILQKLVKDHILASCNNLNNGQQSAINNNTNNNVNDYDNSNINNGNKEYIPSDVKPRDCIIQCLMLLKSRLGILNNEMRKNYIGNILIGLIEKSTDIELLIHIIDIIKEWIKLPSSPVPPRSTFTSPISAIKNALPGYVPPPSHSTSPGFNSPSMREKTIILVKLTHSLEKRFIHDNNSNNTNNANIQTLRYKYLNLMAMVYQEPDLIGTDLVAKLETAFFSGLKHCDPGIRQKFMDYMNQNIKRTIYDRLLYIVASQNWEPMGNYYWVNQCIQLLIFLAKKDAKLRNMSPTLMVPSISKIMYKGKYASELHTKGTEQGLLKNLGDLTLSPFDLNAHQEKNNDDNDNHLTLNLNTENGQNVSSLSSYSDYMTTPDLETDLDSLVVDMIASDGVEVIGSSNLIAEQMVSDDHNNYNNKDTISVTQQKLLKLIAKEVAFIEEIKRGDSLKQAPLVDAIVLFAYQSQKLCEHLWIQLIPQFWNILNILQKRAMAQEFQLFFLSGCHVFQKDCHPSVVHTFFKAFYQCDTHRVRFEPSIIKYLAKAHNIWYPVLLQLEHMNDNYNALIDVQQHQQQPAWDDVVKNRSQTLVKRLNELEESQRTDNELVIDIDSLRPLSHKQEIHDTLSSLYTMLGETDMVYSLWSHSSKHPKTARALMHELWYNHLDALEQWEDLMTETVEKWEQNTNNQQTEAVDDNNIHIMDNDSEFKLWETHWIQCMKELDKWETLECFASSHDHDMTANVHTENVNETSITSGGSDTQYRPQLVLDCAWKWADWNAMKEALTAVQKSCPRELAWKVNLCAGYLALSQSDEHHLAMMDRIVEITTGLAVREWKRLPHNVISVGAHGTLLKATQKVVELQEATQLRISLLYNQQQLQQSHNMLLTGYGSNNMSPPYKNTTGLNSELGSSSSETLAAHQSLMSQGSGGGSSNTSLPVNFMELRSIVKTWKNRVPLISDDFSYWHDIFSWRQQQFNYMITMFDTSTAAVNGSSNNNNLNNNLNMMGDSSVLGPGASTNNNPLLISTHSLAQSYLHLATVCRKQRKPRIALEVLNKLIIPSGNNNINNNVIVTDCFRKIKQTLKCYLELYYMDYLQQKTYGDMEDHPLDQLQLFDATIHKMLTKEMLSEIFALKGYAYTLQNSSYDEAERAFSAAIQFSDTHFKSWGIWGEALAAHFWQRLDFNNYQQNKEVRDRIAQAANQEPTTTTTNPANTLSSHNNNDTDNDEDEDVLSCHPRLPYNFNIAKSAINALLQACRYSNETKVNRYLAHILSLLKYDDDKCTLAETVDKYLTIIPSYHWLPWIPQLLMSLERKEDSSSGKYIMNIITHFGRTYPQAIFFPVRTSFLSLKMEYKENNFSASISSGGDAAIASTINTEIAKSSFTIATTTSSSLLDNKSSIPQSLQGDKLSSDNVLISSTYSFSSESLNRIIDAAPNTPFMVSAVSPPTISITSSASLPEASAPDGEFKEDTRETNNLSTTTTATDSFVSCSATSTNESFALHTQAPPTIAEKSILSSSNISTNVTNSPIYWCRRILHVLRELHPTTLYTLEGLVDQLIWFRETWFEELLQYLKQLLVKSYIVLFHILKLYGTNYCRIKGDDTHIVTQDNIVMIPYGECTVDSDLNPILSYITSIMTKLLTTFESGIENLASLPNKMSNSSTETSIKRAQATLKDPEYMTLKSKFSQDFGFVTSKPGLELANVNLLTVRLKEWISLLERKIKRDLPNTYYMDDKCSLLNNWLLNDVEIELPGQIKYSKPSQYSVKICKFLPTITVDDKSSSQSCRKISVRGSDGRLYSYLVLNDNLFLSPYHSYAIKPWEKRNSSHLRTATSQLFRHVNGLFSKIPECAKRQMAFKLSRMVTISPHMTLVETDDTLISIMDIYDNYYQGLIEKMGSVSDPTCTANKNQKMNVCVENALSQYYNRFFDKMESLHERESLQALLNESYHEVYKDHFASSDKLLLTWAQKTYINSGDFWQFRKSFAIDYASLSGFSSVFALFPIGLEQNILCLNKLACVGVPFSSQIDIAQLLGKAMNENAQPDTFNLIRLTPNLSQFLSGTIRGPYFQAMKAMVRALFDRKHKLDVFLRAFFNDLPYLNLNVAAIKDETESNVQDMAMDPEINGVAQSLDDLVQRQSDINLITFTETMNLILKAITHSLRHMSPYHDDIRADALYKIVEESRHITNITQINPLFYPWI